MTSLRVLLTDGSGLTSRQVATQLSASGHVVDAVAPGGLCLARFTRRVRRVHPVAAFGADPFAWWRDLTAVLARHRYDVLFPTQEQTALLALRADRVRACGVALAVPGFSALRQVQDKVSATRTLAAVGLRQPETRVATAAHALREQRTFPVFVKRAVGTASRGVQLVDSPVALARVASELEVEGSGDELLVLQRPVQGQLVMIQSVFDRGRLVAFHANAREREGAGGGASHKRSLRLPGVRNDVRRLGEALEWHGALSLDAILAGPNPYYIDVNPRLVEPGNAWRAGVDLVSAQLDVSLGRRGRPAAASRPDVRTHQLVLALLGAANNRGRYGVAAELAAAVAGAKRYRGSTEELTPYEGDGLAAVSAIAVAGALLVAPSVSRWMTEGSVASYALTSGAWRAIVRSADESGMDTRREPRKG